MHQNEYCSYILFPGLLFIAPTLHHSTKQAYTIYTFTWSIQQPYTTHHTKKTTTLFLLLTKIPSNRYWWLISPRNQWMWILHSRSPLLIPHRTSLLMRSEGGVLLDLIPQPLLLPQHLQQIHFPLPHQLHLLPPHLSSLYLPLPLLLHIYLPPLNLLLKKHHLQKLRACIFK